MPRLLALSSSALTDRVLSHTELLPCLAKFCEVKLWATSLAHPGNLAKWPSVPAAVEAFPQVFPFKEFPINYLRRLNEHSWDFRLRDPARLSMMRHIRDRQQSLLIRLLKVPARLIAATRLHRSLEHGISVQMKAYSRSPEALQRLREFRPDIVLTTGTFRNEEPAVAAAAMKMGIPVLAYITSWDNISIKNRMVLAYDGYLVWSPRMKEELESYYPRSRDVPVYVVGAPQFDVFMQNEYRESRQEFCARYGLRAENPIVLHALGLANGIDEVQGAEELAARVVRGELGDDVQLIIRPHPFYDNRRVLERFSKSGARVVVQQTFDPETDRKHRHQDDERVREWVNTFLHSDVLVQLSSTAAIDAAILDKPVVGMDYDPNPGQPSQLLINDVNHKWTHYKPVAESGGMWLVGTPDEMVQAIRAYLQNPGLHRERRRWMAEYVCGPLDGRAARRMAQAIQQFLVHVGVAVKAESIAAV